jgi:hypothetical protein
MFFQIKATAFYNWEKIDQAVDSIAKKFGKDTIRRATLRDKG